MNDAWSLVGLAAAALTWGGVMAVWMAPKAARALRPALQAIRTNPLQSALGAVFVGAFIAYGATKPYTVAYDANGGEGTMPDQVCTNATGDVLASNVFTRAGHSFEGWATNATGGVAYSDGGLIDLDFAKTGEVVRLYAVWQEETPPPVVGQIAFDANGGEGTMAPQICTNGVEVQLAASTFTRIGHAFGGWATNAAGALVYSDAAAFTYDEAVMGTNLTLYAVWDANRYQVAFEANGGEGNMATQQFRYGSAQSLSPNAFARVDFSFIGWATNALGERIYGDCASVLDLTAVADATVVLYAVWTQNPAYHVTFDSNGGTGSVVTNQVELDAPYVLPTNLFARAGYTFNGWATSPTGEVAYGDGATVTNLTTEAGGTVPLYAVWTPNAYRMLLDPNGGTGIVVTQACVYATAYPLPANTSTRVGYTFGGWAESATATNAVYGDGAVVSNLTAVADGTATLYAYWTPLTTQMVDGVMWHFDATSGSAVITGVDGMISGDVEIPSELGGVPVTAIGEEAFAGCTGITSLTMNYDTDGEYPEEDAVTVGAGAFRDCTALTKVELPLGVSVLPEHLFANCMALTDFEMPYTVTEIGECCFSNCTALTAITVTENVTDIGAKAFADCSRLKIVRYLGDCPNAAADIYYHANADLVSGCLSFREEWPQPEVDEEEVETGSSSAPSPASTNETDVVDSDTATTGGTTTIRTVTMPKWPEGNASRPLLRWETKLYQFCRVTFNYNDGGKTKAVTHIYVKGRMLGDLPGEGGDADGGDEGADGDTDAASDDETEGDGLGDFEGWFTERYSGAQVSENTIVTGVVTYYAHWSGDDDSERGVGAWDGATTLYDMDDEEPPPLKAAVKYDAYLVQEDGQLAGTAQFKVAKGRYNKKDEETNATVTATISLRGQKKYTMKGTVDESGAAVLTRSGSESELTLNFGANGVTGESDDGFVVDGARNRFSSSKADDKRTVSIALGRWQKTWTVILGSGEAEGEGAAFANGYSSLCVAMGGKGKVKVSGTMADGTKVSLSTQLLVGDGVCAIPVSVPLYANKKGGFGFLIWLPTGDAEDEGVVALSDWDATASKAAPFAAVLELPEGGFAVTGAQPLPSGAEFTLADEFEAEEMTVWEEFLPMGVPVTVAGGKWTLPAKGSVKYVKEDEEYVDRKDSDNPSGLKLSHTAKTGLFTGSFKVYGVTDAGKAKSQTAKVVGGVVGGVGYGTAIIKKVGSVPVTIGGE